MPKKDEHALLRFAVLAADTALFTLRDNQLLVRLTNVDRPPFYENIPGLPGGLLTPNETAEDAALRHLEDKAGIAIAHVYAEQLYTFSKIDRDPRGRVVAVAYLALVPWEKLSAVERSDTKECWWSPVRKTDHLAYDHNEVLAVALARLKSRATYTTLISKLMPEEFTLTELETAYETVLHTPLDKRNFRKKILALKVLKELPHKRTGGAHRPAQLYRFASKKTEEIEVL